MEAGRIKAGARAPKERRPPGLASRIINGHQPMEPKEGRNPGKDPAMPREMTLQSVRQEAADRTLEMEFQSRDRTVWVSLSGILDGPGLEKLISRVAPRLGGRGRRIVLDGRGLAHMDYRTTRTLLAWNRKLRDYGHQLYLSRWSDYLKAILVMEDWDRELGSVPLQAETWRRFGAERPALRP